MLIPCHCLVEGNGSPELIPEGTGRRPSPSTTPTIHKKLHQFNPSRAVVRGKSFVLNLPCSFAVTVKSRDKHTVSKTFGNIITELLFVSRFQKKSQIFHGHTPSLSCQGKWFPRANPRSDRRPALSHNYPPAINTAPI